MNKGNEQLMAILVALRKMPRWALILLTVGIIVILGVAMFLLLPSSQETQGNSTYTNSTGLAFSVFLKMGVIVLVIVGLAIILRRWQSKGLTSQSKQINVLETVHLSPRQTLYLIDVNGQKILIGGTDQSLTNLTQNNPLHSITDVSQDSSTKDFSKVLSHLQSSSDQIETK